MKNLISKIKEVGLQNPLTRSPIFRKWFKIIVGAVHLPEEYCVFIWDRILDAPPNIGIQYNNALEQFVAYFRGYWRLVSHCHLVNQFNNSGPRCTNFAEGYHQRLQHIFSCRHPTLFFNVMRKELRVHSTNAERVLLHGQAIKLRKPKYRRAERQYMDQKLAFRNGFLVANPNPNQLDDADIEVAIIYLNRIS